jgi:hypothetical protein
MDQDTLLMRQRLVQQWSEVIGTLGRLCQGAAVSATDGWSVIHVATPSSDDVVKFSLSPVIFNVPEKANHSRAALYVVADGWIELRRDRFNNDDLLVTHAFSTRAAYFRRNAQRLDHVYGAHYDVDADRVGHPIFHAQLRDFSQMSKIVLDYFKFQAEIKNSFVGVLQSVRTPTAQMDFFSFILQVFADHLLMNNSGPEDRDAFNSLLKRSEFLRGAGARSSRLMSDVARVCYRSIHWYPTA